MKKKNLTTLQLNKIAISNFKSLKGGYEETFIAMCNQDTELGDCEDTMNCETQGGYACGETIGAFCGFRTYEAESCGCY
ncbi:hypothetical protein C8N46_101526 [Kordia periserrulae]|uniref:Uncharacterized protein n=1 Tax=Kordia periserrulae TaxID=701523 RepID=A0A2T6C6K0_9FLAO|nr:hypothetical protein [Kordia periserrulae]PTX63917.1 hypothetical protein C8N46_101526 [Kordia periserrulae]